MKCNSSVKTKYFSKEKEKKVNHIHALSLSPPLAASGLKPQPPSCSKPPKNPITETLTPNPSSSTIPPPLPPSQDEIALSRATHLARREVLRRHSHNIKELKRCYTHYFWALMEELKTKHREFYWKYGVSPFKEEHNTDRDAAGIAEGTDENNNANGGAAAAVDQVESDVKTKFQCAFTSCKLKAMALTSFCHLHICSDSKQKLYKPCTFVIKSAQAACGKPILRSTVPSLCTLYFNAAQKTIKSALKKAGLTMSSSSKLAPKFHVIVAEYVGQIQAERRAALRAKGKKVAIKEETCD